jgi:predicted nucleic acid-binding protein
MLFIYWIESHPQFGAKVEMMYRALRSSGDEICTSILTVGEVLVLPIREQDLSVQNTIEAFFKSGVIKMLPIGPDVVRRFAQLRAATRIASADALHLASAGYYGVDFFVTNDNGLLRHQVAGVQSIAGLDAKVV